MICVPFLFYLGSFNSRYNDWCTEHGFDSAGNKKSKSEVKDTSDVHDLIY